MTEEERVTFVSVRLPRKQAGRHRYDEGMRPLTSVIGRVTFVVQCALKMSAIKLKRAISTGKLNALPRLHTRPINVVVYHGSSGRTRFEVGFPLRCLQRLSRPYVATQHCGWRHNCSTRGTSIPVLSY